MSHTTTALKYVRAIRTFSFVKSLENHPYAYYTGFASVAIVYFNYRQYKRLRKMYPDWKSSAEKFKGDFKSFKRQELHDIRQYNGNVNKMRDDMMARNA